MLGLNQIPLAAAVALCNHDLPIPVLASLPSYEPLKLHQFSHFLHTPIQAVMGTPTFFPDRTQYLDSISLRTSAVIPGSSAISSSVQLNDTRAPKFSTRTVPKSSLESPQIPSVSECLHKEFSVGPRLHSWELGQRLHGLDPLLHLPQQRLETEVLPYSDNSNPAWFQGTIDLLSAEDWVWKKEDTEVCDTEVEEIIRVLQRLTIHDVNRHHALLDFR